MFDIDMPKFVALQDALDGRRRGQRDRGERQHWREMHQIGDPLQF